MQHHYALKIEFNKNDYLEILLLLDKLEVNAFEEGESVKNSDGNFEIINEESLITIRAFDLKKIQEVKEQIINSGLKVKFTDYDQCPNYLDEWKKYAKPIQITKSLTVCPSWICDEVKSDTIILDPAYAFGSGSHETTILCAQALEIIAERESLLDVGCGSGILSLIASRLGYKNIKGIDIDPLAVQAASHNALRNCILGIEFTDEKIQNLTDRYDVIVANIISSVLFEIKDDLLRLLKPNGRLVLSGLLSSELPDIIKEFNFKIPKSQTLGDWLVLIF